MSIYRENTKPRLTGRQIALAEARPIECEDVNPDEEGASRAGKGAKPHKLAPYESITDIVYTSKPAGNTNEASKASPIRGTSLDSQNVEAQDVVHRSTGEPNDQQKKRKPSTRKREKWTDEETQALMRGVAIFGTGRWKDILDHPGLRFADGRTHVNLKDRFRTMFPKDGPSKWGPDADSDPRLKRLWSQAEDADLERGFQNHGFQWRLYALDDTLELKHRTGAAIRDRFRWRFPEIYNSPAASGANETAIQPRAETKRASKKDDKAKEGTKPMKAQSRKAVKLRKDHNHDVSSKSHQSQSKSLPALDHVFAQENVEYESHPIGVHDSNEADQIPIAGHECHSSTGADANVLPPLRWDDMAVQPIFDFG